MQQLKDLMSRDVKVISPNMSIREAAREMRDGDFGMLPVGESDRMIGTISDRAVAWAYEGDSVEEAAKIMSKRKSM